MTPPDSKRISLRPLDGVDVAWSVHRSTWVTVASYLRDAILSGALESGSRVPREETAEELGVSVTPVREALAALEHEGLVTIEPHRGAFVCEIDADFVRDHFAVLGFALGRSAARIADRMPHAVAEIEAINAAIQNKVPSPQLYELGRSLHWTINRYGGSRKLRLVTKSLGPLLPRTFLETYRGAADQLRRGSAEISAAFVTGDSPQARIACERYMEDQGELVLEALEEGGVVAAPPVVGTVDAHAVETSMSGASAEPSGSY